ncbi:hypothetical protein DOY81_008025 [Sarcophaga bullata]|nr:hypothetical protein DOY81_008025 [Sarcophaga bullata]
MKAGGKLYINSPYYPAEYPVGTSCRYVVNAPLDYKLKFSCDIKLNTPHSANRCLNDVFYFNRDGSELLTDSEYFCGTGKMERKSFLNQAVISYISTSNNKRILTQAIREAEQQNEGIKETTDRTETTTTTTAKTTAVPFKEHHQLTTKTNATKISEKIPMKTPLKDATSAFLFTSTPVIPTALMAIENDHQTEDKNVGNSFADVVALLSNNNKLNMKVFSKKTTATTKTPLMSLSLKPTTTTMATPTTASVVVNKTDFLPASTWRNGSIAQHKISLQRVAKVIVGQDYATTSTVISQQLLTSSLPASLFVVTPPASLYTNSNVRLSEGGGSFSCLVEVLAPQCDCGWSSTVKIVGASGVAGINEFPSMAGIMTRKNQKIFCGATIIHRRYLLSAAHCYITPETSRPEFLRAIVGEHDLSTVLESFYTRQYDLISIIIHEKFHASATKLHSDIAILKTYLPIEWNRSVGPACLPFYTLVHGEGTIPYGGERVETAGWGTTSFAGQQSMLLLKTTLDVITRTECQKLVRNLPSGAFCTYTPGRDTCQYDSGGALYMRGERMYAVGIVSYGFACATNQPSINTRISSHLKWIRNKTPDAKYCTK